MTNAQEWLESKFPTAESREAIQALSLSGDTCVVHGSTTIHILTETEKHTHLSIEGELDLSGFNLKMLYVWNLPLSEIRVKSPSLKEISLSKCPQLKRVEGLVDALELSRLRVEQCPKLEMFTFLEG